ncbi:uncharacterized protein [Dermacentor albipictus]|uniref:uncharacterized protein n=1 Tax=Dermacentor albipictus TaxID=60249 RepID=UPI0031FDD863
MEPHTAFALKEERQELARWHARHTCHARILLAHSNTQLIVAVAPCSVAERNAIGLNPVVGMGIHPLLQGSVSTFSEESPSHKTCSSMAVVAGPVGPNDDSSYAFSNLDIEDVLPDNQNLVLNPWNKADERTCGSLTGHPRRLFPRAEWDPLVEMGLKDTVPQCNTKQAPCTVRGAQHQTVVASKGTGRRLMHSSDQPSTSGVEAAASMIRQVDECDAVASPENNLDVLGCRLRIHPPDRLPCASTMLTSIKAESNSGTDGVATPSSCLWRLHARFTPARVAGSSALFARNGAQWRQDAPVISCSVELAAAGSVAAPCPGRSVTTGPGSEAALPSARLWVSKLRS